MATKSRDQIIMETTESYLSNLNPCSLPRASDIAAELLEQIGDEIELSNAGVLSKERKYKMLFSLPANVIVQIILKLYPVACLALEEDSKVLAMYCDSGENEGLYVTKDDEIKKIIEQYNFSLSEKEISDVYAKIERNAPLISLTKDKDLIPVNNGVFDYEHKRFLPFSPDMVFTSKSRVNYNPSATNPIIHNPEDGTDWDVESWMQSLSDDPEIVLLLWQMLGSIIRPGVPWNKSVWMYASSGNNAKGTLCALMRGLCGKGTYASISIRQFGKDVFLENLMRVSAIITDENQPSTYMDSADVLKCAITGDPITIDRKYRSKLTFTFRGMIVQCFNEFPKIKDRTPSFLRRLLIIPMQKCFTGVERKYIKEDYIKRREVLEYVLYKVLNMNYYEFSEPQACKNELLKFREYNDPLLQFWNDFKNEFLWDLLPFQFLYDLYREWSRRFCPSGKIIGFRSFCRELRKLVENDTLWEAMDNPVTTGKKIDQREPLVEEYSVKGWQNPAVCSILPLQRLRTKSTYRGLVRKTPQICSSVPDGCEDGHTD